MALIQNDQVKQARMEFESNLSHPEVREPAEVSLAMLDLYVGKYLDAQKHLESAITLTNSPFSIARVRYWMAVVAGGEGQKKEQIAQLDQIDASLKELKLTVVYGSLLGQAYARAGALEKVRNVLSVVAPITKTDVNEQGLYLELLRAEIKAAEGDPARAVELLPQLGSHPSASIRTLTMEARAHFYQLAGNNRDAIIWYEQFLNGDYWKQGDRVAAEKNVGYLLHLWSDADPNLQLRRDALDLQRKNVVEISVPQSQPEIDAGFRHSK